MTVELSPAPSRDNLFATTVTAAAARYEISRRSCCYLVVGDLGLRAGALKRVESYIAW